eukprot:3232584-Amphidinium_carterae.1
MKSSEPLGAWVAPLAHQRMIIDIGFAWKQPEKPRALFYFGDCKHVSTDLFPRKRSWVCPLHLDHEVHMSIVT